MSAHTLYAYAVGEFEAHSSWIEGQFAALLESRVWLCPDAWCVNQKNDESRDLGVNLLLPNPQQEPEGWFSDVEALVDLCWKIQKQIGSDRPGHPLLSTQTRTHLRALKAGDSPMLALSMATFHLLS